MPWKCTFSQSFIIINHFVLILYLILYIQPPNQLGCHMGEPVTIVSDRSSATKKLFVVSTNTKQTAQICRSLPITHSLLFLMVDCTEAGFQFAAAKSGLQFVIFITSLLHKFQTVDHSNNLYHFCHHRLCLIVHFESKNYQKFAHRLADLS